ncbi:MAG: hypothetical protein WCB90_07115 [Methanosarcina sp.]
MDYSKLENITFLPWRWSQRRTSFIVHSRVNSNYLVFESEKVYLIENESAACQF